MKSVRKLKNKKLYLVALLVAIMMSCGSSGGGGGTYSGATPVAPGSPGTPGSPGSPGVPGTPSDPARATVPSFTIKGDTERFKSPFTARPPYPVLTTPVGTKIMNDISATENNRIGVAFDVNLFHNAAHIDKNIEMKDNSRGILLSGTSMNTK